MHWCWPRRCHRSLHLEASIMQSRLFGFEFREEIHKRGIKLLKIDTKEQLGDILPKGLAQPALSTFVLKFLAGDVSFL